MSSSNDPDLPPDSWAEVLARDDEVRDLVEALEAMHPGGQAEDEIEVRLTREEARDVLAVLRARYAAAQLQADGPSIRRWIQPIDEVNVQPEAAHEKAAVDPSRDRLTQRGGKAMVRRALPSAKPRRLSLARLVEAVLVTFATSLAIWHLAAPSVPDLLEFFSLTPPDLSRLGAWPMALIIMGTLYGATLGVQYWRQRHQEATRARLRREVLQREREFFEEMHARIDRRLKGGAADEPASHTARQ